MALMSFLSQGDVPHLIETYGYWAVAGTIALESIGIPLPGETTLIAAAVVAGTSHDLDIAVVIAVVAVAAILLALFYLRRHEAELEAEAAKASPERAKPGAKGRAQ